MSDWRSLFPFLSPRAKKPVLQPSVRLELNSLEARIAPCQVTPHSGPSSSQFGSHHGTEGHHGHHHHHHHHGHDGNGNNGGGSGQGGGGGGSTGGGGGQVSTGGISGSVVNSQDGTPMTVAVTVTLSDANGNVVATVTTDPTTGSTYSFTGLNAGSSYTVTETPAIGFQNTLSTAQGSFGGTDGTGQISGITIPAAGGTGTGYTLGQAPNIIPV